MRAVGIIAEYNPLHNGHIYHLKQAVRIAGSDACVVAMSGDFVQRGEPAIFDKWTRAEHALRCGADLVVEIPVLYCLGNAGQYAGGAVRVLESLGVVSHLAFGSESADASLLGDIAGSLRDNDEELREIISRSIGTGSSYPIARESAYIEIRTRELNRNGYRDPDEIERTINRELTALRSPNDMLGIEYIRSGSTLIPVAVRRQGGRHDDPLVPGRSCQSASSLRQMIHEGSDVSPYIPMCTQAAIDNCRSSSDIAAAGHMTGRDLDGWWDMLRYSVLSSSADDIDDCPSGGEGLGSLMKREIPGAGDMGELIERMKSRRYTYTRLSRLCMQQLLGIRRDMYDSGNGYLRDDGPGYVRLLGATEKGRKLLAEIRNEGCASSHVVTNINKEYDTLGERAKCLLRLDVHASDIYNLATGRCLTEHSDHIMHPVMI